MELNKLVQARQTTAVLAGKQQRQVRVLGSLARSGYFDHVGLISM